MFWIFIFSLYWIYFYYYRNQLIYIINPIFKYLINYFHFQILQNNWKIFPFLSFLFKFGMLISCLFSSSLVLKSFSSFIFSSLLIIFSSFSLIIFNFNIIYFFINNICYIHFFFVFINIILLFWFLQTIHYELYFFHSHFHIYHFIKLSKLPNFNLLNKCSVKKI